jgi:hypothetical protein
MCSDRAIQPSDERREFLDRGSRHNLVRSGDDFAGARAHFQYLTAGPLIKKFR